MILEIMYNIWFGGTLLWLINMFSTFVFGKQNWQWWHFFTTVFFILIWPFALTSPEGRKYLLGKLHQL